MAANAVSVVTMGIASVAGVIAPGVFGGITSCQELQVTATPAPSRLAQGCCIAETGSTEPTDIDPSTWDAAWTELGYTDAGSEFKVAPPATT